MCQYSLSQLPAQDLLRNLDALDAREHATIAELLAHLAEVDERKLYVPAGYESMYAYCVERRGYPEDVACKRITAARTARRFPRLFAMLASGRLHVCGVLVLGPYLSEANAGELLDAAAGKPRSEIEKLIAERFPRTEPLPMVVRVVSSASGARRQEGLSAPGRISRNASEAVSRSPEPRPIAAGRYELNCAMGERVHEKLRYVRALAEREVAPGDLEGILEAAFDAYIEKCEQRKFGSPRNRHRPSACTSANPRHIPVGVKAAVWERDQGQCTYVSDDGHRCGARSRLEYDHIEAVARGGAATADNLRLRCRAHNQYEAERTFGAGFMERKREAARAAGHAKADLHGEAEVSAET